MVAMLAFPAAMFLLITVAASMDLGRRHGWRHAVLGPIAYCAIYLGLGAGMWTELLRPVPRPKTAMNFSS